MPLFLQWILKLFIALHLNEIFYIYRPPTTVVSSSKANSNNRQAHPANDVRNNNRGPPQTRPPQKQEPSDNRSYNARAPNRPTIQYYDEEDDNPRNMDSDRLGPAGDRPNGRLGGSRGAPTDSDDESINTDRYQRSVSSQSNRLGNNHIQPPDETQRQLSANDRSGGKGPAAKSKASTATLPAVSVLRERPDSSASAPFQRLPAGGRERSMSPSASGGVSEEDSSMLSSRCSRPDSSRKSPSPANQNSIAPQRLPASASRNAFRLRDPDDDEDDEEETADNSRWGATQAVENGPSSQANKGPQDGSTPSADKGASNSSVTSPAKSRDTAEEPRVEEESEEMRQTRLQMCASRYDRLY